MTNLLTALLLGSALSLSAGGIILYLTNLVPPILLELTAVAVVVILPLSFLVNRTNLVAINVSTVLGIVAPIISLSTTAHVEVLLSFGQNRLLSVLGLLQFLGFYLFPITFVIVRVAYRKKIVHESIAKQKNSRRPNFQEKQFERPDDQIKE
jgi:hypothetical protein